MIEVALPWPPTANHLRMAVRRGKGARLITSAVAREYYTRGEVALAEQGKPAFALTGRLGVSLILRPPTRRAFDIDNRIKPVLDLLQKAGLIEDDAHIDEIRIRRGDVTPDGAVEVRLYSLEAA